MPNKPYTKKKKAAKPDKTETCECGHLIDRHNGIEGFCYAPGCKCLQYKKSEQK